MFDLTGAGIVPKPPVPIAMTPVRQSDGILLYQQLGVVFYLVCPAEQTRIKARLLTTPSGEKITFEFTLEANGLRRLSLLKSERSSEEKLVAADTRGSAFVCCSEVGYS